MQNFTARSLSYWDMERTMVRIIAALSAVVMAACATQPDTHTEDAVEDFIVVSELEELSKAKIRQQITITEITDRYVVLDTYRDRYLVEFRHRCYERGGKLAPDYRRERNVLRPGIDTIRGCRIERIFRIDKAQAQELEQLGKVPGD